MNTSPETPTTNSTPANARQTGRSKPGSTWLAWAVTITEAVLWGVSAFALAKYWMMLPLLLRTLGAAGLTILALIGLMRLVRFYRRRAGKKQAPNPGPVEGV